MVFKSPVYGVVAVPVEKIEPNTYNPNAVAPPELKLLYDSIKEDGYTMPVVCYYDRGRDKYILVDGFHRYRIMLDYPDIYKREGGMLPVSIIDKPLDHRMASTIRHNRARGSHDVDLMSNIVKELHELGRSDAWISRHLGMDRDEILRLKQITGLAALFRDVEFGTAWQPTEAEALAVGEDMGRIADGQAAVAMQEGTKEEMPEGYGTFDGRDGNWEDGISGDG
ncbi:MAG: ParB/RepB/Spo0J family partition protein [Lachnospiraceae bacterium]|nr:ParB/RepB/Spo0J family partition protein [Lachnospiraceae bacterium]